MPLVRKDVTIREASTISKENSIITVKAWLEEFQADPEELDDLYYAEIFDSRDNSIYRIFTDSASTHYGISKRVFDILTPDMFNHKDYVDGKLAAYLTKEQILSILDDYALNTSSSSNASTEDAVINNEDLVDVKNDILLQVDKKTFDLNQKLMSISSSLTGMVSREQLNEILNENYYNKSQVNEILQSLTSNYQSLTEERIIQLIQLYIENNSIFNDVSKLQKSVSNLESINISDILKNETFLKLLDEKIFDVSNSLSRDDVYQLFNNLKYELTNKDLDTLDQIKTIIDDVSSLKSELDLLDTSQFITQDIFTKTIKSLVTIEDFQNDMGNIYNQLDRILSIDDILENEKFKTSLNNILSNNNSQITEVASTNIDYVTNEQLNEIISTFTSNNTIENYLKYYITNETLIKYLSKYVTIEYFNSVISELASKDQLNELVKKLESIDGIEEKYIEQLNTLILNYNSLSSDINSFYLMVDDINEQLNSDWYCSLKKRVAKMELDILDIRSLIFELQSLTTLNKRKLNDHEVKLDSLFTSIEGLNMQFAVILDNITKNKIEIDNIYSIIDSWWDQDRIDIIINNQINQYLIENPIQIDLSEIELSILNNTNNINQLNIDLEDLKLTLSNFVTLDQINIALTKDFSVDVWNSLHEGYDEYMSCSNKEC